MHDLTVTQHQAVHLKPGSLLCFIRLEKEKKKKIICLHSTLRSVPFLTVPSLITSLSNSFLFLDGSPLTAASWKIKCSTKAQTAHEKPTFAQLINSKASN